MTPYQVLELYPTINEFKRYLYQLPITTLQYKLYQFENLELLDECIIIESVIQEKISYNVTP